jgi:polyhydroxyalkanoate synthesis regulator phasin
MEDLFKKTISFGIGLFDYTKEKVEHLVDELVKRGELTKQESTQAVEELWEKAEKEQGAFWNKIKEFVNSMVAEMPLVRRSDLKALEDRLAALEKKLGDGPK